MSPSRTDYLLLGVLGICWGSNFLAVKVAVAELTPTMLALGRLAIGAAILLAVVKARRIPWPAGPRTWLHLAGVAIFGNALPYGLIAWAEVRVDSALAGILIAATPLLTMLLAHVALGDEKLTLNRSLGVGVGFLGVLLLLGVDALAGLGADLMAQLALLGAGASYAVSAVVARRMPPTAPLPSAMAATGIGTLLLFPIALGDGGMALPAPGWATLAALLWLGVVCTAVAMMTYFKLVASAGPTFVSLANYLVPLLALGFGAAVLGERPTWDMLLALALILAGVALTGRRPGRGRR